MIYTVRMACFIPRRSLGTVTLFNLDPAVCLAKSLESLVLQGFAGLTRGTLQVQLRNPVKPFATSAYKISSKQTAESRFKVHCPILAAAPGLIRG